MLPLRMVCSLTISALLLIGCADKVQEFSLDGETIAQFEADAARIAARDDARAPIAFSIRPDNQIAAPAGVKIHYPDPALVAAGLKTGDLVALIDGAVPAKDYQTAFAANQKPFATATEQYVDFVQTLIELRSRQPSVLLSVHHQLRTKAERDANGGIHAKEPTLIRIVFEE